MIATDVTTEVKSMLNVCLFTIVEVDRNRHFSESRIEKCAVQQKYLGVSFS